MKHVFTFFLFHSYSNNFKQVTEKMNIKSFLSCFWRARISMRPGEYRRMCLAYRKSSILRRSCRAKRTRSIAVFTGKSLLPFCWSPRIALLWTSSACRLYVWLSHLLQVRWPYILLNSWPQSVCSSVRKRWHLFSAECVVTRSNLAPNKSN